MSKKLSIGLIGAGGNTRSRHIPGFQAIEGVEIVSVCNRSTASSQKVADEFGIPQVAASWQAMLADDAIDAICIGTWPNMHAELTIAALEAGKHVLCEARMACDLAEAQSMADAAKRHPHLVAQIVPAPFSLDYDALIRTQVEAGLIGELREVVSFHTSPGALNSEAPISWRQDYALSGKNIMGMGIFYETFRRWVGQDPEWVVADAGIFNESRKNAETGEDVKIEVPETISILGRYPSGAKLVFHFSGVQTGDSSDIVRLNGSKGSLVFDVKKGSLTHHDLVSGESRELKPEESAKRGWQVEADFVASIREGKPVTLTDFESGLAYMRFTDAVHSSWTHESARVAL